MPLSICVVKARKRFSNLNTWGCLSLELKKEGFIKDLLEGNLKIMVKADKLAGLLVQQIGPVTVFCIPFTKQI